MTHAEIAQSLFKAHWADATEYSKALNAFLKLSPENQTKVTDFAVSHNYCSQSEITRWFFKEISINANLK